MLDAVAGLNRLYTCLAELEQLDATGNDQAASAISKADRQKIETLAERFLKAMDNDFNSAQALGHLFEGVKILNKIRQHLPGKPASLDLQLLKQGAETTREMANILGLLSEEPVLYIQKEQEKILKTLTIKPEEIEKSIAERTAAREAKNWVRADEIRDQLLAQGIELKDGPTTTAWQVKLP